MADDGIAAPSRVNGVITWNCVEFGHYLQEDTNKDGQVDEDDDKQPIVWRVLDASEDELTLMSDKILKIKNYDDEVYANYGETAVNPDKAVTWENSTIRAWLNGEFFNAAFDSNEQGEVVKKVVTNSTKAYSTLEDEGYTTEDNVYLLSQKEVQNSGYGFDNTLTQSATRKAVITKYALGSMYNTDNSNCYTWLLRDCLNYGNDYNNVPYVSVNGSASMSTYTHYAKYGVRPVIHVKRSDILKKTDDVRLVKYKVQYDANGGDLMAMPATQEVAEGEMFYVDYTATPVREGYEFVGWSEDSSSAVRIEAQFRYDRKEDMTLYAIWSALDKHGLHKPRYEKDTENTWKDIITWDCVYFGNCCQSNSNTKEPVKWRVLSVNGDDAFLMADKALDCGLYNGQDWENSEIRKWLNDNFYNSVFTADEQKAIIPSVVTNIDNNMTGAAGGNNTTDNLYLLSLGEVNDYMYGFGQASEFNYVLRQRTTEATAYAVSQGVINSTYNSGAESFEACDWMLRTPASAIFAASVSYNGSVNYYANGSGKMAIRPVLHLNLASSVWYPCGTVDSNGKITGDVKPSAATPTATPSGQGTAAASQTTAQTTAQSPAGTGTGQAAAVNADNTAAKAAKKIKLSSVKYKKNTKKITGKISVKGVTVKIKVGKNGYKKAKVTGKKFVLTLKKKLKKNDKIIIVVSKKDYVIMKKAYKVK